jgi:DNA sulfur modification protein DndB
MVRSAKISPGELRARFLHSHALALQAIGKVGNALLKTHPDEWERRLEMLQKIDWRRENAKDWEGRAFVGGKVSKAASNVVLTGNVIKKALELPLTPSERAVEQAMKAGRSGR